MPSLGKCLVRASGGWDVDGFDKAGMGFRYVHTIHTEITQMNPKP